MTSGSLVRQSSGTTRAFGASGHLRTMSAADVGLSGSRQRWSEVAAGGQAGRLVHAGLDPASSRLRICRVLAWPWDLRRRTKDPLRTATTAQRSLRDWKMRR